jgi:hypothetical protein
LVVKEATGFVVMLGAGNAVDGVGGR